jgi:hypothetical protein
MGASTSLAGPSVATAIPSLVQCDEVQKANSLRLSATQIVGIIVPLLAGVALSRVGSSGVFLAAAITAFAGLLLIRMVRIDDSAAAARGKRGGIELIAGLKASFSHDWLGAGVLASAMLNLLIVAPQSALIPLLISRSGWGPEVLGAHVSALSAGVLLGTVVSAKVTSEHAMKVVAASIAAVATLSLLYLVDLSKWQLPLISGCVGVAIGIFEVTWTSVIQKFVHHDVMGRVYSVQASLSFSARLLSLAVVGYAVTFVEPQYLIAYLACATLVFLVVAGKNMVRAQLNAPRRMSEATL